jgi:hypothetical protein
MKKLLILTGPQGSGNHMWAKIFSETPTVQGWHQLTKDYWIGHGDEPFAEVWEDPSLFQKLDWPHDYYYTSISCPYINRGGPEIDDTIVLRTPKFDEFISAAELAGFEVKLGVIARDRNILECQQSRVRKKITTPIFLDAYDEFLDKYKPIFVSTETLYLYKHRYLEQLSQLLDFPIDVAKDRLDLILQDNANAKYITPVETHWLDDHMKEVVKFHGQVGESYRYTLRKKDD